MPYLKQRDRVQWNDALFEAGVFFHEHTPAGDLNYLITSLMIEFVKKRGLSYESINAALGAAEAAKLEFYRRVAAPYEDKKIAENGDVYPKL